MHPERAHPTFRFSDIATADSCTRVDSCVAGVAMKPLEVVHDAAHLYRNMAAVLLVEHAGRMQPQLTVSLEYGRKPMTVRRRVLMMTFKRAVLYRNAGTHWERTAVCSDWCTSDYSVRAEMFILAIKESAHVTLGAGDLAGCPIESAFQQPDSGYWLYDVARAAGLV